MEVLEEGLSYENPGSNSKKRDHNSQACHCRYRAGGFILEMRSSQSPRDSILWILDNHGGKMERSRLRQRVGMKYADLDPILTELAAKAE